MTRFSPTSRLRAEVRSATVTRYRLAKITGISESTLCRFMAGGGMSLDNFDKLCAAIGVVLVRQEKP